MIDTRPRYADPRLCPDCRAALPVQPFRCPSCALPLHGFLARELFVTLTNADDLLARLRASALAEPVSRAGSTPPEHPSVESAAPLTPHPLPMSPPSEAPPRRGLRGASVASLLLGLGALCLLVAAVIFLAVAWSWLGVGGRTAVLLSLTAATGVAGTMLAQRDLRLAAEALTVVAFGLVLLDVGGAEAAGWLTFLGDDGLLRLSGLALLIPAAALGWQANRLVTPQIVAPFGLGAVLVSVDWNEVRLGEFDAAWPVAALSLVALAAVGHARGAHVLTLTAGSLAGVAWLGAVGVSLAEAFDHLSVSEFWAEGHGWELVVAALIPLLAWPLAERRPAILETAATLASSFTVLTLVLPVADESGTAITLAALAVLMLGALVSARTPEAWYAVPRAPMAGAALVAAFAAAWLVVHALDNTLGRSLSMDPYTADATFRLLTSDSGVHPLLLLAAVAGLGAAAHLALPRVPWFVPAFAASLGTAALLTLALYPMPVALVLATGGAVGAGLLGLALPRTDRTGLALATAALSLASALILLALPSAVLSLITLAVLSAGAAWALERGRFPGAEVAGIAMTLLIASTIWTAGEVGGLGEPHRAAPILLVLGALAIWRPRPEIEGGSVAAGIVAGSVSVGAAADVSVSLAVHLTLAGALVTVSALVNPSRRPLAWLGGLLLASATWVRLFDVGVEAPEAYTLPSATALLLVGLYRLHTSPDLGTGPALLAGLTLATVPSLLWVLADPLSPRAVLLGLACLALVLVGAQIRWHGPVVVGAGVGATVVLRELAPYAAQTPQWALIGAAGIALLGAGITWESRMQDLRRAAGYLGRLR
jgi:hypothetical protein